MYSAIRVSLRVAVAALATLAACTTASAEPAARLTAVDPVVIRGEGFAPGEKVRVLLVVGETEHTREVRATRQGAIEVSFPEAAITDRCNRSYWARAERSGNPPVAVKLPDVQCPVAL